MFFKKAVLKNFHRKTPVLDSVFIKAFTPVTLSKKGVFCEYCKIVKNTYFEEHLQTAASGKETIQYSRVISLNTFNSLNILKAELTQTLFHSSFLDLNRLKENFREHRSWCVMNEVWQGSNQRFAIRILRNSFRFVEKNWRKKM